MSETYEYSADPNCHLTIPKAIMEDTSIPLLSKCVLGRVYPLAVKEDGCFLSNEVIAKHLGVTERGVAKAIKALKDSGIITTSITALSGGGLRRTIRIAKNLITSQSEQSSECEHSSVDEQSSDHEHSSGSEQSSFSKVNTVHSGSEQSSFSSIQRKNRERIEKESSNKRKPAKAITYPETVEEVTALFNDYVTNHSADYPVLANLDCKLEAENFLTYWKDEKAWKRNGAKVKSVKGCVATWIGNWMKSYRPNRGYQRQFTDANQQAEQIARRLGLDAEPQENIIDAEAEIVYQPDLFLTHEDNHE